MAAAGRHSRGGALVVVGIGIKLVDHLTREARSHIERASKVLFLVSDPPSHRWLAGLHPNAESLHPYYAEGKDRMTTYAEMVDRILALVRGGEDVCVVSYGHPAVCSYPLHEAVRLARAEGYDARMLPGISSADCLFADLGVDPGSDGCQMFEATQFVKYRKRLDLTTPLILWQIGLVGVAGYRATLELWSSAGLHVLADILIDMYGADHEVVVYEAAQHAVIDPKMERVALRDLERAHVSPLSTLYVPPKHQASPDPQMVARLDLEPASPSAGAEPML